MKRIASLDGLRAVAITMVLISHLEQGKNSPLHHFSSLGYFGVRIFFIISGFLITRLLVNERHQTGRISLWAFYSRRFMRIAPAMWFYLAVLALLNHLGLISLLPNDLLVSFTYIVNFHQQRSWFIGHLWSISVEEQFYLIWPLTFSMFRPRIPMVVCLVTIAISPVLRFAILMNAPGAPIAEWFPTICDTLATGCVLGLISANRVARFFSFCYKPWFCCLPAVAVILNSLQYHTDPRYWIVFASIGQTVINCCIVLTIGWLVTFPQSLAGRVLNSKGFVWLGSISYSLYIWQQPFLNHDISTWITSFPRNLIFALLAAFASYYLIERPVLQLRTRLRLKVSAV